MANLVKNPNPDNCMIEICDYSTGWPHYHQCVRKWKVEQKGVYYCTQHSPKKVAARLKEADAKYNRELDIRKFNWAAQAACKDVPIELLKSGIVHKLIIYAYEMGNQSLIEELEG